MAELSAPTPASARTSITYVELYSSYLISDCDQRAFVLRAVGIEHLVAHSGYRYVLLVPEEFAGRALEQLRSYEEESRPAPVPEPLRLLPHAWIGSVLYTMVMLGVAYSAGANIGGFDWYEAGILRHSALADGELWRIVTALTLHGDVAHILGNLLFGVPYAYFASQLLGGGRAWASILLAAALANLIDAAIMPSQQGSLGASTAVFAMLGIVGAFAWRRGQSRFNSWAHRLAPLIAAVALLAVTGAGGGDPRGQTDPFIRALETGPSTDVIAHLAGFATGVATGFLQAHLRAAWLDRGGTQIALGAATVLALIGAWSWALAA